MLSSVSTPSTTIGVVYAGGTISALATPQGYLEGGHTVDLLSQLRAQKTSFPANIVLTHTEVAYTGLSENIDHTYWQTIASKVRVVLAKKPQAILITHGTDSMEQTARYLANELGPALQDNQVAIIITGANRDLSAPDTDAWDNLLFALEQTQQLLLPGVYVAFHRHLIPAGEVTKEPFNGHEMNYVSVKAPAYATAVATQAQTAQSLITRLQTVYSPAPTHPMTVMTYAVNIVRPNHQALLTAVSTYHPRAVLLTLYHSGTANTENPELSVANLVRNLREKFQIVFFGVTENGEPVNLHAYETSVKLRNAGVVPLYNLLAEVAAAKLRLLDAGLKPVELITELLTNRVGEIDPTQIIPQDIAELEQLYR